MTKTVDRYLHREDPRFCCPPRFHYQFEKEFDIKISNKCCHKLKKNVAEKWSRQNGKSITITGMRKSEGGLRAELKGCAIFSEGNLKKFHPLLPVEDDFVDWFIKDRNIALCKLYYEPYNFKRTGCKGCPYSLDLQNQLFVMANYLPEERKQCEIIWGKIYDEYRRINYRLENTLF